MFVKVLVIEDEAVIRRGIIKKIPWEKYQITEVLEADNGELGYKIILRDKPEIVFLDICLPKMDGIAVLKKIRRVGNDAKVIIISGHDEFEYAQQAIEYGTENYLLKPSSPREIEAALIKVCTEIRHSDEKEQSYVEMRRKLEEMLPYFRSGLINAIISGDFTDEQEIVNLSSYLSLNLRDELYIAAVIIFTGSRPTRNNAEEMLLKKVEVCQWIAKRLDREDAIIDGSLSGRILLVLPGQVEADLRKTCFVVVDGLMEELSGQAAFPLLAGIGNVGRGIRGIRNSYAEALLALENRFVEDCNKVFFIGDVALDGNCFFKYPLEEEKRLLDLIKVGQKEKCLASIDNLIDFLQSKKEKYPINLLKIHLKQLTYAILQIVYELGGDQSDLCGEEDILAYLDELTHISDYRRFLHGFTAKLCDYVSNKRYLKFTSILRKVICYIEQNYTDENLNLERIADHIGMHPNYVSHLFKKEKGESLSGYICRYRIKKAAEAIGAADVFKISDIAYDVGFNDAHYFTTCFKNILGVTPSEYKQIHIATKPQTK
jgi:two-component system response regulator YesN